MANNRLKAANSAYSKALSTKASAERTLTEQSKQLATARMNLRTAQTDFQAAKAGLQRALTRFEQAAIGEQLAQTGYNQATHNHNVSKQELVSNRRTRVIVKPRQIAMYLAKTMTPRSFPEIGRRFGGRDHTTVMHGVKRIEELRTQDSQIADDVELLRRALEA